MNLVLFGAGDLARAALRASEASGFDVVLVVAGDEPLASLARQRAIDVRLQPDLRKKELEEAIDALAPNVVVAAGYPELLPARFVRVEHRLCLGIHPSLLPAYRGPTPTSWAMVNGDETTGVTIYRLEPKAYEGAIVASGSLAIGPQETHGDVSARQAQTSAELLTRVLEDVAAGESLDGKAQDDKRITFFPAVGRRDGLIKFDEPTTNVHNRIRAMHPSPGAHTFRGDRSIEIVRAEPVEEESFEVQAGLAMRAENDAVVVKTANGAIRLWTEPSLVDDVQAGQLIVLDDSATPLAIKKTTESEITHTKERYGLADGAEAFPKMVVLATVYPCNAVCPNCPYTETNSDIRRKYADQPFMDRALFHKIADECGVYGSFVRITGGGEPMMHPSDMVSLIEYAKGVDAKVWLNTNGSLLPQPQIDRLLACELDQIEFSVDAADPETYAVVRAGLDWDNLLLTVRSMVEARNRSGSSTNIVVSVIEQETVVDRMDEIVQFWLDVGVDEVMRRKFLTWGSNTTIDAETAGDPTPYLDKTIGEPCPYPFHRLNIDSRGKVEVCGYDIAGRTNLGSVYEQSIHEIWTGPTFEWWRRMHLERRGGEIPLCRECPDWQYRSWTHNWEKVMRTAESHRIHAIELTDVATPDEKTTT